MPGPRSLRALSVGLAFLACWAGITPLRAQTGTAQDTERLRGTVVNSVTHQPIGRALVYSSDEHFAALTDASGHFEFKIPASQPERQNEGGNLPAGSPIVQEVEVPRFYLSVRKPGFLPEENSPGILVGPGQDPITISLLPEARIVGHVTVADADSGERFQVEIYRRQVEDGRARWVSAGRFRTLADGEFRFSMLYPGTYKLFTHEMMDRDPLTFDPRGPIYGYPPVYYPTANGFAVASTIKLTAGTTFRADLTPSRREYYSVEIGLTNAPSEMIPLNVTVSPAGQAGPGYSLGYDPSGPKIQGSLPDGNYVVEASSNGPVGVTGTTTLIVNGGPANASTLTLVPNVSIGVNVTQEFTDENANLRPALSSNGVTVLRRPLQINLMPDDDFGDRPGASLSKPDGTEYDSLAIENVQPGRYWANVESAGGYAASVTIGDTDLLHHPLVVSAGGLHDPIAVTLRDDGARVEGIIENMPASPQANDGFRRVRGSFVGSMGSFGGLAPHVYFIPLPDSTGQYKDVWVGPDGKFTLRQVPPGEYRVVAFDRPQAHLEYRNTEAMRKQFPTAQEIELQAGQSVQLQLQMISGSN